MSSNTIKVGPGEALYWVGGGETVSVIEPVPHGCKVEVVRHVEGEKFRVRTKVAGIRVQEFDAFRDELLVM